MKFFQIIILCLFISATATSQENENVKVSKVSFGINMNSYFGGETLYYNENGGIPRISLGPSSEFKITIQNSISDRLFYKISLPLYNTSQTIDQQKISFRTGLDFGFTYLPKLEARIKPFLAVAFTTLNYEHINGFRPNSYGPKITRINVPITIGLSFSFSNSRLMAGLNYNTYKHFYYYGSNFASFGTDVGRFSISLSSVYDFNYNNSKTTKPINDVLSGLYFSSSAIITNWVRLSDFNQTDNTRKFISKPNFSFSPEFNIGLGVDMWDIGINYRKEKTSTSSFDVLQELSRTSIGIELRRSFNFKSQFYPFVAVNPAYSRLTFHENYYNIDNMVSSNKLSFRGKVGIEYFPLKYTNISISSAISYTMPLKLEITENKNINFTSIEFNIIELKYRLN